MTAAYKANRLLPIYLPSNLLCPPEQGNISLVPEYQSDTSSIQDLNATTVRAGDRSWAAASKHFPLFQGNRTSYRRLVINSNDDPAELPLPSVLNGVTERINRPQGYGDLECPFTKNHEHRTTTQPSRWTTSQQLLSNLPADDVNTITFPVSPNIECKSPIGGHSTCQGWEKHPISSLFISDTVPTCILKSESTHRPSSIQSSDLTTSHNLLSSPEPVPAASQRIVPEITAVPITTHNVVRGFHVNQTSTFAPQVYLASSPASTKMSLHSVKGNTLKEQQSSLAVILDKYQSERKQALFKDEVKSRAINNRLSQDEDVFDSDEEDEDTPESAAAGDEDDSGWEDSATNTDESSIGEEYTFQRVYSKPPLVSKNSLLTTMIHRPKRAAAPGEKPAKQPKSLAALNYRPRTSIPNDPSIAAFLKNTSMLTIHPRVPRSRPIVITTSDTHPLSLSPRTTRRNMLATELSESLRKHLLWERQQRNTTANAVLKRRPKNNRWSHEYFDHGLGNYHQVGW